MKYMITVANVNNNIRKTLKFALVGCVKRMNINKFLKFPVNDRFC